MRIFIVLLALILASCTSTSIKSGFIDAKPNVEGDGAQLPFTISDKSRIIIWMHGTTNSNLRENCAKSGNHIPTPIKNLTSKNVHLYYLCSKATDQGKLGQYIYRRVEELNITLNKLHQLGLKSHQIYVAGHSAGGWTALMAMKRLKPKFNAAIAFAPACCGPRALEKTNPEYRQEIRVQQVADMVSANRFKALVFAYQDDAYNRDVELEFLKIRYPKSVKLVPYNCNQGHTSIFKGCKAKETQKLIQDYIAKG